MILVSLCDRRVGVRVGQRRREAHPEVLELVVQDLEQRPLRVVILGPLQGHRRGLA
eukprot:CAMPEP_0198491394 /NCGR_PEP_ID=MMETSP1462-20131121/2757_1 /TAXON_ID=1333877 /ORGANISM="Brandtodinium nutriculum, Strain RCC3387" /LENGTH=55 /DNA_ID=CAMNT_0044219999 /DNA_START=84 /DNA_END=247 /DNA_ORIENTATION=-